ncbi:unnamed protein product [Rotaria socialis]|uniref:Uncharacterized protein n=1 Tax=Rotaria socialis TaxID=392032 RepID=A0A817V1X2_9BILA|nr:unnamed protein product [Rotaria socialis]CAF3340752.1 unnamed protein product [Rotaria socialis]CAF3451849.1 unnamed protein product [Rotaria socialis]CAF3455752.1 unnamed protein product [Rotaria socialis]CAF4177423.1 unnamed protein product [Rotaria socialis]
MFLATTTPNPLLGSFSSTNSIANVWTQNNYSYTAVTSGTLTLNFILTSNSKFDWYIDDVSVYNSTSTELLTNGDFQSSTTLVGWASGNSGSCGSNTGISTSNGHMSTQSYVDQCSGQTAWIQQSFSVTNGDLYSISFWYFLDHVNPGLGSGVVQLDVTIS